jgi:8-amino-7-oxononanoate synthase
LYGIPSSGWVKESVIFLPSMDLLDKLRAIATRLEPHAHDRFRPFLTTIDSLINPGEVIIQGRRTLMFGSNNYLGLTNHPEVIAAAKHALDLYGSGTTGSRIANGTLSEHEALEQDFAKFFGKRAATIFTTGYQANLGMIGALCGPGDVVMLDAESHASICDATRLSGAEVVWVQHNSPSNLAKKLGRLPKHQRNRLVVVEGLYSIRGDVAPLREIVEVCREYGAYILVDEAHSFGIYGKRGLGWAEEQGVLDQVDFLVGTFSKTLGGVGGFCVSDHLELREAYFLARAYAFTASGTPASVAGVRAALAIIGRDPSFRERLWRNVRAFRAGLQSVGYDVGSCESPLIPVYTGPEDVTMALWQGLLEAGVYVNLVIPPGCPKDQCLLRTSVSAAHTAEQVKECVEIFAAVGSKLGFMPVAAGS